MGQNFWGTILDFLLPRTCLACCQFLWKQKHFCSPCLGKMNDLILAGIRCPQCSRPATLSNTVCTSCLYLQGSYAFDQHYAIFNYKGLIKQLIIAHKFYTKSQMSIFWADILMKTIINLDIPNDYCLVACPSTHHQAMLEEISYQLNERHKLKMRFILKKKVEIEQKNLRLKDRLIALQGNVLVMKKPPRKVILVDDIFTTGSTMGCSAQALKDAGSERVIAITLAMVILKPKHNV